MAEGNRGESSTDEYLHNTKRIKPRRSLTALPSDVMNLAQAEDLSRPGKQQGQQQIGVGSDQCRPSVGNTQRSRVGDKVVSSIAYANMMDAENERPGSVFIDETSEPVQSLSYNVENSRRNETATQLRRLWSVDSGRPSSDSTEHSCGKNLRAAEDIDSWLSASVIPPVKKRVVVENSLNAPSADMSLDWNTPAQLANTTRQGFYSEALLRGERSTSATGTPSSEVQGLNSGTLSVPRGDRNTSTATHGLTRSITMLAPPVGNLGPKLLPQYGSSKASSFPARCSLDSLGGTSSSMFAKTPVLPSGMRLHVLASLWPTPARVLGEPSPVATVMPQVQMTVGKLQLHPTQDRSIPTEAVVNVENTSATGPPQTRKRKRKRRSVFGPRRRTKKSHQTTASHADDAAASHNPVSNALVTKQPVVRGPKPVANVHVDAAASVAHSEVPVINGNNQMSTTIVDQSSANASVRNQPDRVLKPIENQQRCHLLTSTRSDNSRPSVTQKGVPLGSRLETKTSSNGREAPMMNYTKRHQSSADVQKVPSTSPERDIFEFCGDDDETGPSRDWRTPRSSKARSASSQSTQRFGWSSVQKPPTVTSARHRREQVSGSVTQSKLR